MDLRVVATRHQMRASGCRQAGRFTGPGELGHEHLADQRLRSRIRGVVHHETAGAEDAFQPASERIGNAATFGVRLPQIRHERGTELGGGEQRLEFVESLGDGPIELNRGHWSGIACRSTRKRHGARFEGCIEDRTRTDLVPVVILGVNPEDGDCRHSVFAPDALGEFERRQRLEQGEEGPSEQTRLLTREDRHGLVLGQCSGRAESGGRSPPALLLGGQDCRNFVPTPRLRLRPADGVYPGRRLCGVARKKGFDRSKVVRVVGRKPTDPGELSYVYRYGGRGLGGAARLK